MAEKLATAAQRNIEQRILAAMQAGQRASFGWRQEVTVVRTAGGYEVNGIEMALADALAEIAAHQYDRRGRLVKA
jgi:hypothetical protein